MSSDAPLTAAELLNLPPEDCVVFEDSISGIKAALSAGSKCVAVATTHDEDEINTLSPHLVILDFQGFHPDRLQEL